MGVSLETPMPFLVNIRERRLLDNPNLRYQNSCALQCRLIGIDEIANSIGQQCSKKTFFIKKLKEAFFVENFPHLVLYLVTLFRI